MLLNNTICPIVDCTTKISVTTDNEFNTNNSSDDDNINY